MAMINVSELKGKALDYAVALCEQSGIAKDEFGNIYHVRNYSSDWAQGGPILEREKYNIQHLNNYVFAHHVDKIQYQQKATTILVAVMRCYVFSELGETVEIPDELLEE